MDNDISGDRVRQAYKEAPLPIRDTFNSDKISRIVLDMRSKYQLHVDTAGVLGKEIGYLLLGLTSPMEFLGRLVAAGVEGNAAKHIASDINEQIFIPLQKAMKDPASYVPATTATAEEEGAPALSPSISAPEVTNERPVQVPVPAIEYQAPVAQTLPGSPVPAPMPQQAFPEPTPSVETAQFPSSAQSAQPIYVMPRPDSAVPQPGIPAQPPQASPASPIKKEGAADPYREPI